RQRQNAAKTDQARFRQYCGERGEDKGQVRQRGEGRGTSGDGRGGHTKTSGLATLAESRIPNPEC
ncbi:MAG TPA: hypothetical protein VFW73_08835, partial [Lacipirellulaceae bacterium]|nr:hypothetical protein [Lacipirellulaceae bacterium]